MGYIYNWVLKIFTFLSALLFSFVGIAMIIYGGFECISTIKTIILDYKKASEIISEVLKGIDLVFLGIVIQLLGIGLYELFLKPIENLPDWLKIKNFDQLKVLLVKASITVITISFVGRAVTWSGDKNIIFYGVGIGAIIASLSYFIQVKQQKDELEAAENSKNN